MPHLPPESSHSIGATRPSLLQRIGDPKDAKGWAEFYALYRKLVFGFALRFGLTREDAEEVTQDVFGEVARSITTFESDPARGTFRSWLLNLTRWRVLDRARRCRRVDKMLEPRGAEAESTRTSTIENLPDPGSADPDEVWAREWEHRVLETALERLATRVDPRHFQLFELHVRQGWPLGRLARHLEMNRATVYVINYRLKKELVREVAKLRERLN